MEIDDQIKRDAELWNKHKDVIHVALAMLEAATPTILNRLKLEDAAKDATT